VAPHPGGSDDVYFGLPGVATVRWDEPHATVHVDWDGWANTAEFSALLDAELKALRDHGGSRLLADCRRQRALNPADQERADDNWVPLAIAAGLRRFAVVLPESDIAAGHLRKRLAKVPAAAIQIAYFGSVEKAREWLAE
jgi:hypothetical protein